MKILLISHFFPPTHTSGAENYTYNLAREFVTRGHDVRVICAGDWDKGEKHFNGVSHDAYHGIMVSRVHLNWTKASDPNRFLYDNPLAQELLHEMITDFQPDLAHVTSCLTLSSSVITAVKASNIPLVLTLVDFWFICPSLHLLRGDGSLCDGQTTEWDCLSCLLHNAKAYHWAQAILPERAAAMVLGAASRRKEINRISGLRGMALDMGQRKQLMGERLRQVDLVIAPSRFMAAVHRSIFPDLELRIQEYGHDLSWLTEVHQNRFKVSEHVRFLYIGQISPVKGVHVLLKAFSLLEGRRRGATLDVYGSLETNLPYSKQLREIANQCEGISLRDRFPRSKLGEVMSNADVVVVPSIWYENNPLVIQEAFAAGKPVIASDLGGMSEFVEAEINGLLFRTGDSSHLSSQMLRLIESPHLIAELRNAIPTVYTIGEEVDQMLHIYDSLLAKANPTTWSERQLSDTPLSSDIGQEHHLD